MDEQRLIQIISGETKLETLPTTQQLKFKNQSNKLKITQKQLATDHHPLKILWEKYLDKVLCSRLEREQEK